MCKKQVRLFLCDYMINDNENEVENEKRSHTYGINRPRPSHRHKLLNTKCILT